jgi:prepilin-type N-terminal cleavage/methylation domain-containing protein
MNRTSRGFTVIEIIFVIVILGFASIIFFVQKNSIEIAARDEQRKTAINAMYYGLEEVYFKQNNNYPRTISEENLPSVDPALFTDVAGKKIGESESEYRYEATNCTDTGCAGYTLRSTLDNEDDYVKRNN